MTPKYPAFDYSKVQGIPEVVLRVELLRERLQHLSKGSQSQILEVGVGAGDVTLMLARHFEEVTCVDPDEENCDLVLKRLKEHGLHQVEFIRSKVQDAQLSPAGYYHIVLLGILEHLEDPVKVLHHLATCLQPGGYMYIIVNLANSLHRWLGVEMGLISHTEELSESDILYGHYRVYTRSLLREHVALAGLQVTYEQTFYLKPLPTSLLTPLPMEIHRGLYLLGQRFPEFASYMYMEVCALNAAFGPTV